MRHCLQAIRHVALDKPQAALTRSRSQAGLAREAPISHPASHQRQAGYHQRVRVQKPPLPPRAQQQGPAGAAVALLLSPQYTHSVRLRYAQSRGCPCSIISAAPLVLPVRMDGSCMKYSEPPEDDFLAAGRSPARFRRHSMAAIAAAATPSSRPTTSPVD